jgi:intracellular multiplication protein IcmN
VQWNKQLIIFFVSKNMNKKPDFYFKNKPFSIFLWLGLFFTLLTGCAPYVSPPYSALSGAIAQGSGTQGAVAGGIVAIPAEAIATSTAIGAVAGATAGAYWVSTPRILKILQNEGVQVIQVGGSLRVIIPTDRLFSPGSTLLEPQSYRILDDVAMFLIRYGDVPLKIYGFSDAVYDHETALQITGNQARRVSGYLWSKGRPFYHLIPRGMGNRYAVASNGNPTGSAYNRRIEIILPVLTKKAGILKEIAQQMDL